MSEPTSLMSADAQAAIVEQVVLNGDLSKLSPKQRVDYYRAVCQSLGLNPLTKPFDYLQLNGKTILYAGRTCTDQLRNLHKLSVTITGREVFDDVYVVSARGVAPDGREDESTGAVSISGLKGEAKANAYMKAETKAKRRLTLSLAGLGMMDESEVDSVRGARRVEVDYETGEILEEPTPAPVAVPSPPSKFVAAGFDDAFRDALIQWIGSGKPVKAWGTDHKAAFKELGEALIDAALTGVPVEELRVTALAYTKLDGEPLSNVAAAISQVTTLQRTWVEQSQSTAVEAEATDGLPPVLPF